MGSERFAGRPAPLRAAGAAVVTGGPGTAATVRHLRGRDALTQVAGEFDALCARAGVPFTSRRTWLQAWADTHRAWEPWLVLVEDTGGLRAAAPLAVRRSRGVRTIALLGHGPTDDARLPADPGTADALAAAVVAGLPAGPWRLRLQQVPDGDPVVGALVGRLRHARLGPGQGMPLVRVSGSDPAAHVSKNTRKALAKVRNRLADRGLEPVSTWTRDAEQVRALLPELVRVHRERDLALGRRADHDDPSAAAFYEQVVLRHAAAGEVDLLTLRLDGDLAAYVLGFRDGRAFRSWDNRLAPRWADLSAGRLANTEAIRHVVTSPDYDALDWMRGEEPYKLQSATEVVPTAVLQAWSHAALRQVEDLAGRARDRARDVLHRSPALRSARARVRALR